MKWLNTPHDLYTSTEFRMLRAGLMQQRVNAQGILCCAYCGRPILRDYDCIAHHITEVSAANVNDASITLNPDNIQLVHLKCHNAIHERFGCVIKKVYLVSGSPCSGKNTFVQQSKGRNDIIMDTDAIWQAVTGEAKYFKPDTLKQNVFLLRDALMQQIKMRTGKWNTAYVLSTEPRRAARERLCASLGAEEIHMPCDRETALTRLANDPERVLYVKEWTEYINNYFEVMT